MLKNLKVLITTSILLYTTNASAGLHIDPTGQGLTDVAINQNFLGFILIGQNATGELLVDNAIPKAQYSFSGRTVVGLTQGILGKLTINGTGTRLRADAFKFGTNGNAIVNVQNGATLLTKKHTTLGEFSTSNATLTITSPESILTTPTLTLAHAGDATINISNQGTLAASGVFYQADFGGTGRLNITGQNSTLTAKTWNHGRLGTAITNILNGATATIELNTIQANRINSTGLLNISGQGSKLTTTKMFNGGNGLGTISLSDGAQLQVQQTFRQYENSVTELTLSPQYLSSQNFWPIITGDTILDGDITPIINPENPLQDNQTFNLMQIQGPIGGRTGTFKNLQQNDSLGIFGQHEIFISYTGGDGNDITLYTQNALTNLLQGDTNQDQIINNQDLQNVINHFGTNSPTGDANHDHQTNLSDLFSVRNNLTAAPTTIPEPTTLTLLTLTLLALTKRRK